MNPDCRLLSLLTNIRRVYDLRDVDKDVSVMTAKRIHQEDVYQINNGRWTKVPISADGVRVLGSRYRPIMGEIDDGKKGEDKVIVVLDDENKNISLADEIPYVGHNVKAYEG